MNSIVQPDIPEILFHGTARSFDKFEEGRGGFYFTDDYEAACAYARVTDGDEPQVLDVRLSIRNPMILTREWYDENVMYDGEEDWEVVDNTIYTAQESGYDGLILKGFPDFSGVQGGVRCVRDYDQYIVFDSSQITIVRSTPICDFESSAPRLRA